MSNSEKNILFAMSAAPFWHCGRTITKNSMHYMIALMPAVFMAIWHWGIPALGVMSLSILVAMLTEELFTRVMHRTSTIADGTAAVSGLLLAFLMPANAPYWIVILAAFCAISLGKMAFGGYGANPVNTVLVGWAMVFVSFPVFMDPNSMLLQTDFIDPLVRLKYFGAEALQNASFTTSGLMFGEQIGALGASQILALLVGGLYLLARGVIRWEISLFFLIGVLLVAAILNEVDPSKYASPFFHLMTGSTILCAFFLATEFACAPDRSLGMILFGLTGGALLVIIRTYGVYTDGAPFAVMLANLLCPYFDMIKPKPFGVKK